MTRKKILSSLAVAMTMGAACALAANPFVEVPSDSWEYQSIVELANDGLIQGVNGTYFQGQGGINRYEAAEMTAKAMVHVDQATPQQRAQINKLASEYSKEISSFFEVRESAPQNRIDRIWISGDFRLRYRYQKYGFTRDSGDVTNSHFAYRMRPNINIRVNDNMTAVFGVSTNNKSFDDETEASTQTGSVYTDAAYVTSKVGKDFNVKIGRWADYNLETGGPVWFKDAYVLGIGYSDAIDKMQAQYKGKDVLATIGYGQFKEGSYYNGYYKKTDGTKLWFNNSISSTSSALSGHSLEGIKTGYAQLEGRLDLTPRSKIGGGFYYDSFSDNDAKSQNLSKLAGFYVSFDYDKWHFINNYEKYMKISQLPKDKDAALWTARLVYGNASLKKNTWDAWLGYVNADPNAMYGSTGSWRNYNLLDNVRSWEIGADFTVARDVVFTLFQTFDSKLKDSSYGNTSGPGEESRAQFLIFF